MCLPEVVNGRSTTTGKSLLISILSLSYCRKHQWNYIAALAINDQATRLIRAIASGRAVLTRPLFGAISSPVFVHSFPAPIVRAVRCGAGTAGCIDVHVFQRKVTRSASPQVFLATPTRLPRARVMYCMPCRSRTRTHSTVCDLGTFQHSFPDRMAKNSRAIHGPTCSFLHATALLIIVALSAYSY